MNSKIQIFRRDQLSSDVTFPELAEVIDGSRLTWFILSLWAVGEPGWEKNCPSGDTTIQDLETRIRESPIGMKITWNELKALFGSMQQIIDTEIIGTSSEITVSQYTTREQIVRDGVLRMEMVDSNFWEFESEDNAIITHVKRNFVTRSA